jgi:WD40 repeat protein
VQSIGFDPLDGSNDVVALIDSRNQLILWRCSTGTLLAKQPDCCALAWKPDGSHIATTSLNGAIKIFKVTRPQASVNAGRTPFP